MIESTASLGAPVSTILVGNSFETRAPGRAAEPRRLAADVREVPPSSEARIDDRLVRGRIETANLVAMIVDYTGHDLTNTVRRIQTAGATFNLVITRFGPSRILASILAGAG